MLIGATSSLEFVFRIEEILFIVFESCKYALTGIVPIVAVPHNETNNPMP
jgi:hypothetical protein